MGSEIYECMQCKTPTIIDIKVRDFRKTGVEVFLAEVDLVIKENVHVADDYRAGSTKVAERLAQYFKQSSDPTAKDGLFPPAKFDFCQILSAVKDIKNGEEKNSEVEKYIKSHTGFLIIHMDHLYINTRSKTWHVCCWLIDTDDLNNNSLSYFIQCGMNEAREPKYQPEDRIYWSDDDDFDDIDFEMNLDK